MKRCHRRSAIPSVPALSLDGNRGGPGPDYCCHCHGGVSKVHWETGEMETATETLGTGKLFYIIPRHNRANLSVHTRTQGGEAALHRPVCFFKVHIWNISLDFPEYRFHGKKKSPVGFRFTFAAFSAMSGNYSNELWRSSGTQTPGELAWCPPCTGETAAPATPRLRELVYKVVSAEWGGWTRNWSPAGAQRNCRKLVLERSENAHSI